MSQKKSKPRGTATDRKAIYLEINPVSIAKLERVSSTLGVSKAFTLDLILQNLAVDTNGRPAFWDGPLATDFLRELPLASSA